MNKDDITRMAREAGLFVPQAGIPENGALTRFAALVAAAELRRLLDRRVRTAEKCAAAIRARGNT